MSTQLSLPPYVDKAGEVKDGAVNQALSLSTQTLKRQATVPPYVDNDSFFFKHDQAELCLTFTSDWRKAQTCMETRNDLWAMYFPPSMNLEYDGELEARLVQDLNDWSFLPSIDAPLARLGLQAARLCSVKSSVSYERRILLHRHITWIFYMDQVSEKLATYDLHSTAGTAYLENLKSLLKGGPVTDMTKFRGSCPDALIDNAINAQRILSEDLMPLKRKLLSPQHLTVCVDALDLFFDTQKEEGQSFCVEPTLQDIYKTRAFTVGTMVPFILFLSSEQAELFTPEDPCLIQLSVMAALWNDMLGIFKDLNSLAKKDDGSVYLNFVRASMRDQNLTVRDALHRCGQRLNNFIHDFEFFQTHTGHFDVSFTTPTWNLPLCTLTFI
ncbi:terpenoid synthase [Penicillium verhagenii]|nr:terpenoid synthase [Penicillium verhagenii]